MIITFSCLSKVKVHVLEQKCRLQSEHLHQYSKELLNFHLQQDTGDILSISSILESHIPLAPEKHSSKIVVGVEPQLETGESVTNYFFAKC